MTKKELEVEFRKLLKAAEYIKNDWLENDRNWPVFKKFDASCKRARKVLDKK